MILRLNKSCARDLRTKYDLYRGGTQISEQYYEYNALGQLVYSGDRNDGWDEAAERYENFIRTRKGKVLFLELCVGYNTPVIIKIPFWNMTVQNPKAIYACINKGEAVTLDTIADRSICIDGDIGEAIERLI